MGNIMKIVKSLEDSGLLLKGVSETIQNEAKEQKGGFLSMLLGRLGVSLLGNMLAGEGIIRAGYGSKGYLIKKNLILPYTLTNLGMQKYYQNEPKFNGVYSRDNLPDKTNDAAYVINIDEYSDIGTHWIALYALNNNATYFASFGVEHIPREIQKFTERSLINKSTTTNIYRIQAYDSVMCGYFCIGFIDFMLKDKSLTA